MTQLADPRVSKKWLEEYIASLKAKFNLEAFCFDKQIDFIRDPAKYKLAVCSRRAGKTVGCAADLINTALNTAKVVCLYITLSRNNAKKIIWNDLLEINRNYSLGGVPNETELSLKFPNQSVIYCSGAKDRTEIEKFRGLAIKKCYIDEVQSFKDYVRDLIDQVISKALFDYNGTLCLTGTPPPVPTGYFYECWNSGQWSNHHWTMFDNPWLLKKSGLTPQQLLDQELKRKGVTVDDPTIQRECFGRWAVDTDSLVFKYNKEKNDFDKLPHLKTWHYIIGVDIGFDDSDAIAVIAWSEATAECYLVEEKVTAKQGITELANQIDRMIKTYNPDSIVMDTGGLGKKIAEEMNSRYSLPIRPAEKTRKFEFIELLNDALRTRKFFASRSSRFAQDCMLVEWDKEATQLKVSDRYHSDICDAVLYAYRESLHWLHTPSQPVPKPMSDDWFRAIETEAEETAVRAMERSKMGNDEILYDAGLTSDSDWD